MRSQYDRREPCRGILQAQHRHRLAPVSPIASPSAQITVLADLYATALEQLEPEAVPAVREHMCDVGSEEARRDAVAALAVCERLSSDS